MKSYKSKVKQVAKSHICIIYDRQSVIIHRPDEIFQMNNNNIHI